MAQTHGNIFSFCMARQRVFAQAHFSIFRCVRLHVWKHSCHQGRYKQRLIHPGTILSLYNPAPSPWDFSYLFLLISGGGSAAAWGYGFMIKYTYLSGLLPSMILSGSMRRISVSHRITWHPEACKVASGHVLKGVHIREEYVCMCSFKSVATLH